MAAYPDLLDKKRHRELAGRERDPWLRRLFLLLLAAFLVAALLNVFGQRSETVRASSADARLEVHGPKRLRGGLLYQQRITVRALHDIAHPRIVLGTGWLDGQTLNTIEPGAVGEASRDGRLVLSYDQISAGDKLELFLQYQVNPTHVGRTDHSVELDDAERPLARVGGTLTTFP